ncbi:MAG: hypothetical protein EOO04_22895 [Chitinophagaceae bacterium]|nr:MAG: hypothetical protein EOO04_22895 [Chitinophagaceae bacterium]
MPRLLTIVLLLALSMQASAQLTYKELWIDYDSAVTYKNLKVIPVRKKLPGGPGMPVLSFGKAVQEGKITLSERGTASTENVPWLRVNNNSGSPVFIASGEVVMGGRQDRMTTRDTIIESMPGDQYIPVVCVEENRWSKKEKKFHYASYANPKLRKVLDHSKNQLLVWKEIYAQLDSSDINSPTFAYAARKLDKKYLSASAEYLRYFQERLFQSDSNIVGVVCITGNKIMGSDIFSSEPLFTDQFATLLTGYIEEAISYGGVPAVNDTTVKKYLDQFLVDQPSQDNYLKKHGKIFRRAGEVFHLTSY